MLRRLLISFVLLLAFALLQAHNFIPHHHHEIVSATDHHHHDGKDYHHHDGDKKDNDTDHSSPFTDLTHNADFGKVAAKPQLVKDVLQKPIIELSKIIWLSDKIAILKSPPDHHPPGNDTPLHTIFLSHSLPLRAPPVSSCLS